MIMKRTVLLLVCIVVSILINAQSVLCLYKGGYFIRNGNTWYEYRPQSKDAVWNQYTQYSTDDNYYYVKNSVCKISIPKKPNNSIWINKGSDWKVLYTTIHVYNYCPQRSSHLFCFEDGFFIKKGNKWDLYMPLKSATEVWNSYTEYKKDKDYYYIKNSKDDIAIPRSPNNSFYLMKSGDWKKWKSSLALYDAQSKNAGSGLEYAATTTTSSSGSGTTSRSNNQQNYQARNNSNSQSYQSEKKTWREDLGYGMFAINVEQNGTRNRTIYRMCPSCRGSQMCMNCMGMRQCTICQGRGGIVTSGYGRYIACTACNMTGACSICKGTGKCICTNYEYPGYVPGSTMLIGANGQVIHSDTYSYSNNGGSSSSSSSSHSSSSGGGCSRCGGTGVEPSQSSGGNLSAWLAYSNREGDKCPYCHRYNSHQHTRCASCNVPR